MNLATAAKYFDTAEVDGWNGSAWVPNVVVGNLAVFDRFISDRNFGQRKRNFTTGHPPIASTYSAIRIPNGQIYLIEARNVDTKHGEVYSTIYLLHEAPVVLDVIRIATTPRSSGAGGTPVETVVADDVFADIERYGARPSEEHPTIRYAYYEIYVPASTDVKMTDYLRYQGQDFNVIEVHSQLELKYIRAVARGSL